VLNVETGHVLTLVSHTLVHTTGANNYSANAWHMLRRLVTLLCECKKMQKVGAWPFFRQPKPSKQALDNTPREISGLMWFACLLQKDSCPSTALAFFGNDRTIKSITCYFISACRICSEQQALWPVSCQEFHFPFLFKTLKPCYVCCLSMFTNLCTAGRTLSYLYAVSSSSCFFCLARCSFRLFPSFRWDALWGIYSNVTLPYLT